jgi:UDP-glucose 4-epimerase
MKTALVTGGAGFVGTNLIKRLLSKGYEVVSIDNYSTGFESNHQKGAKYYQYDCADITDYSPFGKFDVVYHLAAIARIQPSFNKPLEYFQANATATFNIAMYCAKNNIPLQFAGSSSHHSGKFKNPYTFSKDVSEEIVRLCQDLYGLQASVTRFYNVYGPHHLKEGGYCTVIGKWEKAIEDNQPITIYGTGAKRRDFTHIDDIVSALLLIETKEAWGHIFELGTGTNYSINEVAAMFKHDSIIYEADKPGEAEITICDYSAANNILGWKAVKTLPDYINHWNALTYAI